MEHWLFCYMVVFSASFTSSSCAVYRVCNQSQLDLLLDNITLQRRDEQVPRTIHLSLTANTYQLNITKFVHGIDLKENDILKVMVEDSAVIINCVNDTPANISEYLQSRRLLHASMVVFDGLVFTKCLRPIYVEEVNTVVIQNCVFQQSKFGAVNIFNSPNVIVSNCSFHNNTSDGSDIDTPFQPSSGGLSISYSSEIKANIDISVNRCNFTNNSAISTVPLRLSINRFFLKNIFGGRGGGLAIVFNTSNTVNCIVNNSVFVNNEASIWGGGLYCVIAEAHNHQNYMFENLVFTNNRALVAGAFTYVILVGQSDDIFVNALLVGCRFVENTARIAGVANVYFYNRIPNNSVIFEHCNFTNNSATVYAGTVDIVSYNFFDDRSRYTPITFLDCMFDSNYGADAAAINLAFYNARFGNVTFKNNTGGSAVRAAAGKVQFDGSVRFFNNTARVDVGGALYLTSFSQMRIQNGTHLYFINNTGSVGAAAVAVTEYLPPVVFSRNYRNSRCFLQYSDPTTDLTTLEPNDTSINFMGNKALGGQNLFASELGQCSWFPVSLNRTNIAELLPFIRNRDDVMNNQGAPILTASFKIILHNSSVYAYPGEKVLLVMTPLDPHNHTAFAIAELIRRSSEENNTDVYFSFSPTANALYPSQLNYYVSFTIRGTSGEITDAIVNEMFLIAVIIFLVPNQTSYFNLTITPCPAGNVLSSDMSGGYACQCNNNKDENIVDCIPDEDRLILQQGLWATNINTGESLNGMMEYYQCPPGYCQCSREDDGGNICNSVYYYDNDDLQCVCDRQGYLCGKCHGDKGVSVLLNKCVSCGHGSIALIFGLVLVDIIVITVILLSSVTIFSWLYPILFYIQVTPYIAHYFPVTFSAVQPYLHYISSAASLYFPYDFCIYPGMTALVSYSLRYIPVLLFSIIYCIIYLIQRRFPNISVCWSGVWLLILLLFTDVVNTSVSILNCPILRDSDGHRSIRWFVDGTVKCFSEGHAGLATFAILVLIVCTLLIIALVVVVLGKMKKIKSCLRLKLWTASLEKLLQEPFVDQYNWWAPTELIRRLLFIILITAFPGNLIPVMLLVMISVAIYMYIQPYQGLWTNILEVVLLGDILLMVMITSTDHFKTTAVFDSDHSFSIDQCGNVDQISEHAAVLIPFYFLPLIILFGLITQKTLVKVKTRLNNRERLPTQSHYSRRNRSTRIVDNPIGHSYVLKFNTMKDLTLRLIAPQHLQSATNAQ